MSSIAENINHDRNFKQINLISTREITWKIPNFKSLPRTVDYSLDSPPFHFENATWCLRLYTHSEKDHCIEFTIVRLRSRVPHHRLRCNLIWPDEYDGVYSVKVDFEKNGNEIGKISYFIDSELLTRYTSAIDETKIFTLICQISCHTSQVKDAYSQTEQDTKFSEVGDLCQNFKNLLLNALNHDLVLKVKNRQFRAHQNILRVRLPVINFMLSSDMIGKSGEVIDIPDCDSGAFEQFLHYLYSGKLEALDAGNMLELYYVADKFDVGYLKKRCRDLIKNSLTFTNVSATINIALNHTDADLLESATEYFVRHINEILHTVEWQSFVKQNPIQANELFIKATANLAAEKNCKPGSIKKPKNFNQTYFHSTRQINWKIPNFNSLPKTEGYSLDSPPFHFLNATWCLRLYPHLQTTYVGFTIVRLCSRVPRHTIRYNLIWPDELHGYHSVDVDFDEDQTEDGDMTFVDRSLPIRRSIYGIDESDVLKLRCQMSSYCSPVADAFSQTEQDIENIGELRRNFKDLLLKGRDHDLVLKVKDREFRAHRNILQARSSVLEFMLDHDMIEKEGGVVDISDCDPVAFEQFLLYLYCGEVETLDADNMLTLYYIADKYDKRHLKEQCNQFIRNSLTSINVSDVIQLALHHSDAVLLECATDYFVQNVHAILRTLGWQSFVKHNPTEANDLFIKAANTWDAETLNKMTSIAK